MIKQKKIFTIGSLVRRRRISRYGKSENTSFVAEKGHFVVYTTDGKRFMIPLAYLDCHVLQQLFKISEDEFGMSSNNPITMPCDAVMFESMIIRLRQCLFKNWIKKLVRFIAPASCN